MGLSVYSAKLYSAKMKVTIQATGKLGFTTETASALGLTNDTYIKIAGDDEAKDVLYMIVCPDKDEDGFKTHSSSGYYYLQTTMLFNDLHIDYKNFTVMFDLNREPELDNVAGGTVYKMNKRQNPKKKKEVAR